METPTAQIVWAFYQEYSLVKLSLNLKFEKFPIRSWEKNGGYWLFEIFLPAVYHLSISLLFLHTAFHITTWRGSEKQGKMLLHGDLGIDA